MPVNGIEFLVGDWTPHSLFTGGLPPFFATRTSPPGSLQHGSWLSSERVRKLKRTCKMKSLQLTDSLSLFVISEVTSITVLPFLFSLGASH